MASAALPGEGVSGAAEAMRFNGRVAIVTGGGRGMGRAHCLELARRGTRVVVNDLGGAIDGSGSSAAVADEVVREIEAAGGVAVPSPDSVATEDGAAAIVRTALDAFGRVDVLVHNAGTVTYTPLAEMTYEDYRRLVSVHLDGGFLLAKAVWPHMQRAATAGSCSSRRRPPWAGRPARPLRRGQERVGGPVACAVDGRGGARHQVQLPGRRRVHPDDGRVLGTASFKAGRPEEIARGWSEEWWRRYFRPDIVSPAVALLAHEDCPLSGETLDTQGGCTSWLFLGTTQGFCDIDLTAESLRDHLETVLDPAGYRVFHPASGLVEWRSQKMLEAGAEPV